MGGVIAAASASREPGYTEPRPSNVSADRLEHTHATASVAPTSFVRGPVELSDSSSYIHRKFDGYVAGPWIAAEIVVSGEMAPVTTNTLTTTGMPAAKASAASRGSDARSHQPRQHRSDHELRGDE